MTRTPPLTITLIIDRLAGRSGGAERVIVDLANSLSRAGHRIEIVHCETRTGMPFYPVDRDVLLTNLTSAPPVKNGIQKMLERLRQRFHRNRRYLWGLRHLQWISEHGGMALRLDRHLKATAPDVAIAFLPNAVVALGLARQGTGIRRIASLHNVPMQDFDSPERWDQNPLDKALRRRVLARFDAITVLLPEFVDWFDADLRPKVTVIPNVVPIAKAQSRGHSAKRVIAVGRLSAVKGFDHLIEAWAKLPAEYDDWTCDIYGQGPMRGALQRRIDALGLGDRVTLAGHTNRIFDEYQRSSFMVHPAAFEGFGLVVAEALAHGLPVVGFAECSGFNTLVQHDINGLHVERDGLADGIAALMVDPVLCQRLGAAGPASVAGYGQDAVIRQWRELIEKGDA